MDGLPGREGVFLPCSFWLADCWHLLGRKEEARELFERLLALRNDLGLLSEEYDPRAKRQLGNFPQAFSHVALLGAARILNGEQETVTRNKGKGTAVCGPWLSKGELETATFLGFKS